MSRLQAGSFGLLFIGVLVLGLGVGAAGIVDGNTQSGVSVTTPESVTQDGTFEFTVETTGSAGTIVEINSAGRDISLSTDEEDAVKITDSRIEFIDPNLGDSQYTITVDHSGGTPETPIEVSSWINAAQQSEADDSVVESIDVQKGVTIVDQVIEPANITSAPEHTLSFDIEEVSADNNSDEISIDFPPNVEVGSNPEVRVDGELLEQNKVEKQNNSLLFSVNPSSGATTEGVSVKIDVELSSVD